MRTINKLGLLLPVMFLVLFTACDKKNKAFPEDLYVKGQLIRPDCVTSLAQGDSARFDPKPVLCSDENKISIDLQIDSEKRTVSERVQVFGEESHMSYQYIGPYQNKHVLLISSYSMQATGRFMSLILVKRQGDTLLNKGELAAGDRAFGGVVENVALSGSQLTYEQNFSSREFVKERVADFPKDIYGSPQDYGYGDRLVYRIDLSHPKEENGHPTYPPKTVQLKLSGKEAEQGTASSSPFDRCYLEKRQAYLEKGYVLLSEEEAKVFANAVAACLTKGK